VPILGRIAAGSPNLAAEDVEGREGRVIRALPHEPVFELLQAAGRV